MRGENPLADAALAACSRCSFKSSEVEEINTTGSRAIAPPILAEDASRGSGAKPSLAASERVLYSEAASGLRFGTGSSREAPSHYPNAQEVGFWSITLLARSPCGTCPRSRFRGSFTGHFDGYADHPGAGASLLYTAASIIAYPRTQLRRSACRALGISESVALRVLCSNCALSPAPQRACRSGRDSQSFSCGGGTPRTRDDSSSQ